MSEGPALSKGPDAFRTISEVAEELDLPQHVLRFWETRFTQIRPMKRGGGRRYYRPDDVDLLRGIRRLLYGEGYTIKGVQRILKEQGPRQVVAAGQGAGLDPAPHEPAQPDDFSHDVPAGILVDRDTPPTVRSEPRYNVLRREPTGRAGRDVAAPDVAAEGPGMRTRASQGAEARREPVFGPAREPAPTFAVRPPEPGGRVQPPPIPTVSRIPAAPPDEPDTPDVYLPPPLVATGPAPPERGFAPGRPEEPVRFRPAGPSREPVPSAMRAFAPPPEPEPFVPESFPGEPAEIAPHGPTLSPDDIRILQATLVELLECKRILDQAR